MIGKLTFAADLPKVFVVAAVGRGVRIGVRHVVFTVNRWIQKRERVAKAERWRADQSRQAEGV